MPETDSPSQDTAAVGQLHAYSWGVRTALRDNATAYGFSISITAAYGLASAVKGPGGAGGRCCSRSARRAPSSW
jgi:hypothetical protein